MSENLSQFSQGLELFYSVTMVTFSIPPASNSSGISFHFYNRIGSFAISKPITGKGNGITGLD